MGQANKKLSNKEWVCFNAEDDAIDDHLEADIGNGENVKKVSFGPNGYLVLYDDGTNSRWNAPPQLERLLIHNHLWVPQVEDCALGNEGMYYIKWNTGDCDWEGPSTLSGVLSRPPQCGVKEVLFGPGDGWLVRFNDGHFAWNNLEAELSKILTEQSHGPMISSVSLGLVSGWRVDYVDGSQRSKGCPEAVRNSIGNGRLVQLALGPPEWYYLRFTVEGRTEMVSPLSIRYSVSAIMDHFDNGDLLADAISSLQNSTLAPSDFPPIRVLRYSNAIWSLDNRRLFVFQRSGQTSCPVVWVDDARSADFIPSGQGFDVMIVKSQ